MAGCSVRRLSWEEEPFSKSRRAPGLSIIISLFLSTVPVLAQAPAINAGDSKGQSLQAQRPTEPDNRTTESTQSPISTQQKKKEQKDEPDSKGEQTKRMFWVVPNFGAVSANTQLPPLSARGKFALATEDSVDYSSFVWTGILAAQSFGLKSDPDLGQGLAGYGRYYWRTYVDGFSGTYFTEAIVPVITHQDPRYFTMGEGGFFRRLGFALSRTVVTRTDSSGTSFNWSEAGGNALEATLSNAYYPPQERGLSQTLRNWGAQMESAALNNIAKEFWPDIRRKILRRK